MDGISLLCGLVACQLLHISLVLAAGRSSSFSFTSTLHLPEPWGHVSEYALNMDTTIAFCDQKRCISADRPNCVFVFVLLYVSCIISSSLGVWWRFTFQRGTVRETSFLIQMLMQLVEPLFIDFYTGQQHVERTQTQGEKRWIFNGA